MILGVDFPTCHVTYRDHVLLDMLLQLLLLFFLFLTFVCSR